MIKSSTATSIRKTFIHNNNASNKNFREEKYFPFFLSLFFFIACLPPRSVPFCEMALSCTARKNNNPELKHGSGPSSCAPPPYRRMCMYVYKYIDGNCDTYCSRANPPSSSGDDTDGVCHSATGLWMANRFPPKENPNSFTIHFSSLLLVS